MSAAGARPRLADLESALADAGLPGTVVLGSAGGATVVCVPVPSGARAPVLPSGLRALASCAVAFVAAGELAAWPDAALPAADPQRADFGGLVHVPPVGELEASVALAWEDVLGDAPVGRLDDLRACEGFSLMAVQVAHRLQAATGRPVSAGDVRESCAVWDLARRVGAQAPAPRHAPAPATPGDAGIGAPGPLSAAQRRIWLADSSAATPGLYNIALGWRIEGPLDEPALRVALDSLADRHEMLRMRVVNGPEGPLQVVHARGGWPWRAVDVADDGGALDALRDAEACRPFELDVAPPVRATLGRLGEGRHVLLLTLHHVACDGWSVGLLCRELAHAYASARAGRVPGFDAPAGSYLALARKESQAVTADAGESLAYWRDLLMPAPPPTALPLDRPRPRLTDHAGAVIEIELEPALDDAVRSLARRLGCTAFAVHAAALQVLLLRHGAEPDVCIGYTVANRRDAGTGDVVGCFIDTLPLRTRLRAGESFSALVGSVAHALERGDAHHDRPFDDVLQALAAQARGGGQAPFSVLLNHNLNDTPRLDLDGARTHGLPRPGRGSAFDLVWNLFAGERSLRVRLEYAAAVFDEATARGLVLRYRRLLREATQRPATTIDAIALLDEDDLRRLAAWSGRDAVPRAPASDVVGLFEAAAARHPGRCALRFDGRTVTYGELQERASRLASHLRALGVVPGDPVAVCLERGSDGVVALLAVFKSGGVYLPLDAGAPALRHRQVMAQAGVRALVTQDALQAVADVADCPLARIDDLPPKAGLAVAGAGTPWPARSPAYCIHTSGSTGAPKGVLVSHGALAEHVAACIDHYGITSSDRLLQFASTAFDAAIEQTLTALCAGASLLVRGEQPWTLADFLAAMRDEAVTVADVPTAWWQHLAARDLQPGEAGPLRLLIIGGEPALVRDRLPHGWPRTLNAYGPTEATITTTIDEIAAGDSHAGPFHPIGRPLAGAHVHVLDDRLAPVPPGVVGELHIGGSRLALGYLGRPDLTAERFGASPFGATGECLYRTGDRVRFLADGRLEFIGRRDGQVKLRGFRVELGEVEQALARHPGVAAAAVIDRAGEDGDVRLVAFAVPRGDALPGDWRDWLRERLPDYMVPAELRALAALPTGAGGKVDRKALARAASQPGDAIAAGPAPAQDPGATVERLQRHLLAMLPSAVLGPDDDLVDAGFHSLHLMRLSAFCRAEFGLDLGLRDMLRARSLRKLAQRLDGAANTP